LELGNREESRTCLSLRPVLDKLKRLYRLEKEKRNGKEKRKRNSKERKEEKAPKKKKRKKER
jgi:hypothetical protein